MKVLRGKMAHVLLIDDDKMLCEMLTKKLSNLGHESVMAHNLAQGLRFAREFAFDLVFLDVRLPDGSGLEVLSEIKATSSSPEVIIITGEGDPDGAQVAIETGAWDYLPKPLSVREVALHVTRALEYRREKMRPGKVTLFKRESIIGSAPCFEACLEQLALSASTDIPLLITGATGAGKERFARAVHLNSARVNKPFVVLDCASLPESLIESMLFGHKRGSFSGAYEDREGLISQADRGTLFLDEVGELPLAVQKSFLRVLQERRFRPVGGGEELTADFRLVAATNRNLEKMVSAGQFRKDLMYRLNAATIHLPPLKDRKTDIEALVCHYVPKFCKRYGIGVKGRSPEFLQVLEGYDWPGNVRELVNAIDYAVTQARLYNVLYPNHLPAKVRIGMKRLTFEQGSFLEEVTPVKRNPDSPFPLLKDSLEDAERNYLETLLAHTNSDISSACQVSGLSRSGLYSRFKKYNIDR
ncbi:MAG: two-component system NtrC family response regulator [Desulforhopalus sp.]